MTDQQRRVPAEQGPRMFAALPSEGLGSYVLMPGDPDRVSLMASMWEHAREYPLERGFRAATGTFDRATVGAISSGMGGPSLEIALSQVAERGATTFIRVGTSGALREDIRCGDLVINEASVRIDGTSDLYVAPGYPAAASYEVTMALIEACERLGFRYHLGIGATAASFYAGQGRPAIGGYARTASAGLLPDLQAAGVINFEMEAATLLTLSRIFGLRAGVIVAIVANRVTGEWDEADGVSRACRAAAAAVAILTDWDRRKVERGLRYLSAAALG